MAPRTPRPARVRELTDTLEREGVDDFEIELTGKGHVRVTIREGDASRFVIVPASPGDKHRGTKNFIRAVRKARATLRGEAPQHQEARQ